MDKNEGRYERGIDVRQLIRLPLLPPAVREGLINSLDVASTLRDNLRDFLSIDVADQTTQENRIIKKAHWTAVKGIRKAECHLMRGHAMLLSKKKFLLRHLRRPPGEDVDVPDMLAKKYNLIKWQSFLPYIRSGKGGRKGFSKNYVEVPCHHLQSMREITKVPRERKEILEDKVPVTPPKYEPKDLKQKAILQIEPEEVIFENYAVGKTYTFNLKLQNTGDHSASLKFILPIDPVFEVCWGKQKTLLVPGLSVPVTVSYLCTDKDDRIDRFMIHSGGEGNYITVPIRAFQIPPPSLISQPRANDFWPQQALLLKSTIDCGKCYVGRVSLKRTTLRNPGSVGRFFLLSEQSWHFNNVKDITEENVLIMRPFYIQPAHFTLQQEEHQTLRVVFSPEWEGSHVVQAFILCDNLTLRSLDILGEAIMFYKDLFTLEDLEKNYDIFIDDDVAADHYLYLGRMLPNTVLEKNFYLNNASIMETRFRLEVSRADIPGVNFLDPQYGVIQPTGGALCPERRTQFTVTYYSCQLPVGRYVAIFSIFLEDIPKAALPKGQKIMVSEETTDLMVTVCLGRIEVWLDIEHPNICLWPSYLYFLNEPYRWNIKKLYVTNYENDWIILQWRLPILNNLLVHPSDTELPPFSSTVIYVLLQTELAGRFVAQLSGHFMQSLSINEVLLECETVHNLKRQMSSTEDLGILRTGELKISKIRPPFSLNYEVDVEDINHFSLRYDENHVGYFMESDLSQGAWLIQTPTSLQPESPSNAVLKANTQVEQICIDIIQWKLCGAETYTTILSDVQDIDVSLFPLVWTLEDTICRDLRTPITVRFVNHRKLEALFCWAGCCGKQKDSCTVLAVPEHGIVPPESEVEVQLVLTPLHKCFLQDFFYKFSIRYTTEPLIGSIIGVVVDKEVEVSWMNNGKNISSRWPQEECNPEHLQFPSLESVVYSEDRSTDKECEICYSEAFTPRTTSHSVSSQDRIELDIIRYRDSSETSTIPYLNWPYIGGRYYGVKFTDELMRIDFEEPWNEESLMERLKEVPPDERDSCLSRYSEGAMNFTVETFKVFSQVFYITNLSPVPVSYRIKTNRFHAERKLPPLDPFFKAELMFYDEGLGCENCSRMEKLKWTRRVRNDLGLVIRVKEKSGTVAPDRIQAISVSVYAVSWGVYFDDVSVFIDDYPPFHIPIIVKCESLPAFFTFAPGINAPLLRFPSIHHKETRCKTVYLENESPFPLKIVWTVYSVPLMPEWELDYSLPLARSNEFSLAVELHPTQGNDFCKVNLLPYAGVQDSQTYTVEPPVVYLPPKAKAPMRITVNSSNCWFDGKHPSTKLSGTAFGAIYLDGDNLKNEEYFCCYRADGHNANPISLRLDTLVEILSLRLVNCSKSDAVFKMNTSEIFNHPKRQYCSSKTYRIENYGNCAANITVKVQYPCQITAIRQHWGEELSFQDEFILKSFETIEVDVLLILSKDILIKSSQNKVSMLAAESPIISELSFGQKDGVQNILKIEVHLLKPVFIFHREKVIFDQTCVNETQIKDIKITVKYGDQPFKVRIRQNKQNIFTVTPRLGVVRKKRSAYLAIKFTPRECRRYMNVIEFISTTPGCIYPLYVEGTGSLDHKICS